MSFDYRKVGPTLWTGSTGRWLRKQPATVTVVAMYLVTCPSSTQWGLFYLPRVLICNDTGRSMREVDEALAALQAHGFCRYDAEAEVVWVVNMCRDQVGEIRGGDKRAKPTAEAARGLLDMPFGREWYLHYQSALQLPPCPIDAPSMPHAMGHPVANEAPSMPGSGAGEDQESEQEASSDADEPAPLVLIPTAPKPRFDFEALYRRFPRKKGKSDGLAICEREIRTPGDFEALGHAIDAYAAERAGEDEKFTLHFSTFMGRWRDFVPDENAPPPRTASAARTEIHPAAAIYMQQNRWADMHNLAALEARLEAEGVPMPWLEHPVRATMREDVGGHPLKPVRAPLKSVPPSQGGDRA